MESLERVNLTHLHMLSLIVCLDAKTSVLIFNIMHCSVVSGTCVVSQGEKKIHRKEEMKERILKLFGNTADREMHGQCSSASSQEHVNIIGVMKFIIRPKTCSD